MKTRTAQLGPWLNLAWHAAAAAGAQEAADSTPPEVKAVRDERSAPGRRALATAAAAATVATAMLVLDLTWLGVVARGFYDAALGPLKRPDVHWPAAALFYAMYVTAILAYAVVGRHDRWTALRRGAGLGGVAYATYELTNWAILRDWPVALVSVDIAWGVVLTAVAALAGKRVYATVLASRG